jgi:hypothetical protein
MTDLPGVSPLPNVSPVVAAPSVGDGDIMLTLAGLRPGVYVVRDLYPRFLAMEKRMENDPPRSKIQFGLGLRAMGIAGQFVHGHARGWLVTEELLERANEHYAKVAAFKGWS